MRILSRCSDIVVANINAMLDRVESPETMIKQVLRDMEDGLAAARDHAVKAIAAERRLGREVLKQGKVVQQWQAQAWAALAANREDLARLALARKRDCELLAKQLESHHAVAVEATTQARSYLQALQACIGVARLKQQSLIARHCAVQIRHNLCRVAGATVGASVTANAKLQHCEDRLAEWEDECIAHVDLQVAAEAAIADWEADCEIERQLIALNKELAPKR